MEMPLGVHFNFISFFFSSLSFKLFFSNLNTILLPQQCGFFFVFFSSLLLVPLSMIDSQVTTSGTLHVYNTKYNWTAMGPFS